MKQVILFLTCLLLSTSSFSQVGIGTTTPDASAGLDIDFSDKGFLPPRMTAAERNTISSPAQGLMIYCTNCGTNGEAQLYNGAAWVNLVGGTATFGCGDKVTFTYNGSSVTYGTVISANSKCWLDRNLGATQVATNSADTDAYGDLYQWGRAADGHEIRSSNTTTINATSAVANAGNSWDGLFITESSSPNDWLTPQDNNLWQSVNGTNNPCPTGYRIPTKAEWEAELTSWGNDNNSTGAMNSPLNLPMGGRRQSNGQITDLNTFGFYWSSSVSGINSFGLFFSFSSAGMGSSIIHRASGRSVRCLKD